MTQDAKGARERAEYALNNQNELDRVMANQLARDVLALLDSGIWLGKPDVREMRVRLKALREGVREHECDACLEDVDAILALLEKKP